MEKNIYKLADISTNMFYGSMPKKEDIIESGYPIFSGYRIVGYSREFNINERTLIVVARGVGGTGDVKIAPKESFLTNLSIAVKLRDDIVDLNYLYYYLNIQGLRYLDTGAAQSQITINNLKSHKVILPNLQYQKRIANILLKYDNIIENNNKRISILERMTEEIYKEWFVKFRFPEYKNNCFIDAKPYGWIYGNKSNMSIPNKWHFGRLAEIGQFARGKNITSTEMKEGEIPVVSAGIEPSGYHNEANVKGKSLTMSASGANAGYLKYNLNDIWAADCSYYQNDENIWFVYSSLKFIESAIRNLQVGSAQPHVYAKNINKLNIIIPEEKYIKMYNDLVNPMFEEIRKLNEKNKILVKQRDLLLPRLMSGKLEVK